jgi:high-affinity iron transporter
LAWRWWRRSRSAVSRGAAAATRATPQRALAEIDVVRHALDDALATYRSGDRAAADEQVGDAYLEHFELVEGPLGKVDPELTEELEDGIREELRDAMKDGASVQKVERLVAHIDEHLDEAEAALK